MGKEKKNTGLLNGPFKKIFFSQKLPQFKETKLIFALPVFSTPTLVEKRGFLSLNINQTFQSYSKAVAHVKKKLKKKKAIGS